MMIAFRACRLISGWPSITFISSARATLIHAIDLIVHDHDGFRELRVGIEQRLDGGTNHARGVFAHRRNVHRQIDRRICQQFLGSDGNAHGLVANPFQVAVDLDHRQNKAQIDGHRLFLSQ